MFLKISLSFVVNYSETLELSWNIEPNRTESNRTESNFFNISMFFRVRFDRTDKNHLNAIKQNSVRSNQTRKNIEILKKFGPRKAMFNSVRFGSVG